MGVRKALVFGRVRSLILVAVWISLVGLLAWRPVVRAADTANQTTAMPLLTGKAAFGDWTTQAPLVRRKIVRADVPAPYSSDPSDNVARIYPRPANAWPIVPAGFKVDLFQGGLIRPRQVRTAPNGDIFIAESDRGRIRILRAPSGAAKAEVNTVFAGGLNRPFGIAFYPLGPNPQWVYVANTNSLVRFAYHSGDLKASGPPQQLLSLPGDGAHWTRDVVVSHDGRKLLVSVGSGTNYGGEPHEDETRRADILEMNPDASDVKVIASGLRNAVGLAIDPQNGSLWCSVNERDGLGDNLPPDYITKVKLGGFYGWPWFYTGGFQDPRTPNPRMDLRGHVVLPDVLIQPHSASLGLAFYTGSQFPSEYRNSIFAAEHGSSNRSRFTGYKVIFVPVDNGAAKGEYMDFMTGFVVPGGQGEVWGRPVGVTVAQDGSLMVSDDASGSIWRVSFAGK